MLEKALAKNLDFLDEMGETDFGLVVKRGVIEELYYGIEYDEIGNSVSNNYYGHGSDLAHYQRIVYSHLEIVTFLRNILADNASSPELVFEKRRYVQSIVEHFDSLEIFCDPKMEAHEPPDLAMQKNRIYENSWSLGFLIAEYKNRFPIEAAMEKGLVRAKQTRLNDGNRRRKATVKRANQILREQKELIANLPALAKLIEAEKLTAHKQKTGIHIGWQAIAAQLREALKKGLLKNS
ncbi:MAG: hypothetical protein COA53_11135 [Rhodobacteraceae bacterium]|nr:MAG: hypothetical protein COA53_11135 [Paracoccaceae bacterium]